jgi:hypothetical protein
MKTPEDKLARAEHLAARAKELEERVHAADADEAAELLRELDEVSKETIALLEELRRDAGA